MKKGILILTMLIASSLILSECDSQTPDSYLTEAEQQGTLQDIYYDTYGSFSYNEKSQRLQKHAVVYLPYGYNESN